MNELGGKNKYRKMNCVREEKNKKKEITKTKKIFTSVDPTLYLLELPCLPKKISSENKSFFFLFWSSQAPIAHDGIRHVSGIQVAYISSTKATLTSEVEITDASF